MNYGQISQEVCILLSFRDTNICHSIISIQWCIGKLMKQAFDKQKCVGFKIRQYIVQYKDKKFGSFMLSNFVEHVVGQLRHC